MSLNETFSEGRSVQYLCDVYRSKFRLKQDDVSVLFCFTRALVYGIREFPAYQKELKFKGALENPNFAKDANLMGENKHTFSAENERGNLLVTKN